MSAVEFDESGDLEVAAAYGVLGLIPGALVGLLVALPPTGVLLVMRRRASAPDALCAAVTALCAAATITLIFLVLTGFNADPGAVLFCAVVAAVPAGLTAAWIGRRSTRAVRDSVTQ